MTICGTRQTTRSWLRAIRYPLSSMIMLLILPNLVMAGPASEQPTAPQVHEEMWAIPSSPVPMLAYLIRPMAAGAVHFHSL